MAVAWKTLLVCGLEIGIDEFWEYIKLLICKHVESLPSSCV